MPTWSAIHRTPWGLLRVQTGNPSLPTTVTGPARLIALFHWRRGKSLPGVWIVENSPEHASPTPADVDWAQFPTAEAQQEMMAHEERCARHRPQRARVEDRRAEFPLDRASRTAA